MGACSDKSPLVSVVLLKEESDLVCRTDDGRILVFNSALLAIKPTRSTQGVTVATLRAKRKLTEMRLLSETGLKDVSRYRARTLPKAPAALKAEDEGFEQMSLL